MNELPSAAATTTTPARQTEDVVVDVVTAVAAAEDVSPLELSPLADVIDPDALDRAVESLSSGADERTATVRFRYRGHLVTVTEDGEVSVAEPETDN